MEKGYKNLDCRNYAPLDVAKGICHVRKKIVHADGGACELFERLPKCRYCTHYTPGQGEYEGTCKATPTHPMTYPDLSGVTCEWFSWKGP